MSKRRRGPRPGSFLRQRQRLRRNGGGEGPWARAVPLIDVGSELNDAVRRRPGGDVDPVDVDRLRELDVDTVSGADDRVDLIAAPAGCVFQQPGDIIAHVLHPDAARRYEAEVVAENALRRRVM